MPLTHTSAFAAPERRTRPTLSVALIAQDEEKNLPRTLEAIRWADEIVVLDSGSTDRTPEIAQSFGARHSFHRDFRGHGEQQNIALQLCTSDWILILDADEVVTPALAAEIQSTILSPQVEAYFLARSNLFLNRWMRHGGLYPDAKLRLFRNGRVFIEEGNGPHATAVYTGPTQQLRHPLQHFGYPDFTLYIEHMNRYSTGWVRTFADAHTSTSSALLLAHAVLNPVAGFVKNFFLRGGFLDGTPGLVFHLNHAMYVHWKYIKLWERRLRPLP